MAGAAALAGFLASLLWVSAPRRSTTVGAVALGGEVGIVRWKGDEPGTSVQLGLSAGLDVRMWEHHDWRPAWSVRGGLEFGPPGRRPPDGRGISLLFELYDGPSPYGQFLTEEIRYAGVGLHFNL